MKKMNGGKMIKFDKKFTLILMVFMLFFCVSTIANTVSATNVGNNSTNLTNTTWAKFQGDLNNSGQSNYTGPQTNTVKLTYITGQPQSMTQNSNLAIASDGTVYFGVKGANDLYAMNPDGTLKWTAATNKVVFGVAIGSDGTIYAATSSGSAPYYLYAFNPNGTQKWMYSSLTKNMRGITVSNGNIYVGSDDDNLYAFSTNGTLEWTYTTTSTIYGTPAVSSSGTIYVGNSNGMLYAINPNGTLKWNLNLGGVMDSGPSISSNGTIYIGSTNLYAITDNGNNAAILWISSTGTIGYSTPAIRSKDGTIYVGTNANVVYALNPNGTTKWTYTTGSTIYSSPLIGADGTIYIGSNDGYLYALTPSGTLKWKYSIGVSVYNLAMDSTGTLYAANYGTKLYGFQDPAPVASFTSNATSGTAPLSVQFNDTSSNSPTSWLWNFGDGGSSTQQNPTYTYNTPGTYNVTLTAYNGAGNNTVTETNYINVNAPAPVASFTSNATSGTAPLSVQFNDTSSNSPTSWLWTFGDGGSSTLQNPTYTYNTPGTYDVTLTATNAGGNNSDTQTGFITVNYAAPVAGFTENTTSGLNPLNVQFNDQSTGNVTSYYWTFGDGGSSILQNPTYTYTTPGTYTVTETVTGPGGNNTITLTNVITVFNSTPPNVTASPDTGIYSGTQNVTLTSDQPGSTIYYTTDGSNPQTSPTSIPYSSPIPINSTTTLQYAAVNQGGVWSTRYSKTYTIDTLSPTASSNLNGGTYNTTQTATLTSNDPNATIYYTEDTTNPITSSTKVLYTGPINISNTTTLRYAALNPFGVWSPEYIVNYEIGTEGLASTSCPEYGINNSLTGQSSYSGSQTNVTEWKYATGSAIYYASPVISSNGTVYIGSADDNLYAINPNGTLLWKYKTGSIIYGSAAIGANGIIYVGSYDDNLYAINPNGTLQWKYTTGNHIYGSPSIGADGTIYIGSYDDNLYAINPNGTLQWKYTTGNHIYYDSPAIGADGTIYIGSYDDNLYAINPDGTLQWKFNTGGYIYYSPAIGANGTIYIGSYGNNKFYAINPNGTLLWSYSTGGAVRCSPSIGADGTIYVGCNDKNLYAFNPNGTLKWTYTTGNYIYGAPTIGTDGTIYVGSIDENLYAINPNGILKWEYTTGGAIYGSPTISSDGTLYIGSYDHNLYAFKDLQPIANFTASQTTGGVPVPIQFNDTSLYASSWFWNFGDGTNSTLQNPSHTYTTPGNYSVTETVTNAMGNNTISVPITLYAIPPVTNFTASTTSGSFPLIVSFTDQSQYDTTWLWNFGDGTTSTAQNPTHTYLALGNYTVSLTASNSYGNNTNTKVDYIQAGSIITNYQGIYIYMSNHNGTANPDGGPTNSYNFVAGGNNQLHITNNPVTSPSGQVNTSSSQSGVFYITTTGGRGSNDDLILLVAVQGPIPSNFSLNLVSSGYVWTAGSPNTNDYVNGSLNETFTSADFLYGPQSLIPDSSGMNIIYNGENSSNPSSAEYLMFVDLDVGNLNTAAINNGAATVQYTFTNLTTQASFDTYAWALGYDAKWANLPTSSGYNVIPTPTANFTTNIINGSDPLNVQFTDTSSNSPTSWLWNFGDGGSSTQQNPTYTYNTPGKYTVTLTATNADGNNTITMNNLINVIGPVADNTTGLTYITIGAAVNAANNGDTILVNGGNYIENVILNKNLILEASGQVNIIPLDSTQPVFLINNSGSGSTIQGFTITGSTNSGIYINNATGNTILNNTLLGNNSTSWGICLVNSDGPNNITGNNVTNCIEGINLYNTTGANITYNTAVSNVYDGIALTLSNNNNNNQ